MSDIETLHRENEALRQENGLLKTALRCTADVLDMFEHPKMADFARRWAADPTAESDAALERVMAGLRLAP